MHVLLGHLLFAAQAGIMDKLRRVPKQTWLNIAFFVVIVIVSIRTWKALKKMNELAPYIALVVMVSIVFLFWVYNRTEPGFLSPFVDFLSDFLPHGY